MKAAFLSALVVISASSAAFAADATAPQQTAQQGRQAESDQPLTLNGCVARRVASQDPLTFQDENGFKYRITGRNLGRYQGQRVEIIATSQVPKRFTIRGGLYPSPNVAARAGDLDPAREAIARQPGGSESGTGSAETFPELRVTRIRAVQGSCE